VKGVLQFPNNRVRIQSGILQDFREQIPLRLGKCQENVLVRQEWMVAPSGFLQCAVENPLARRSNLALRNFEFVGVHVVLSS